MISSPSCNPPEAYAVWLNGRHANRGNARRAAASADGCTCLGVVHRPWPKVTSGAIARAGAAAAEARSRVAPVAEAGCMHAYGKRFAASLQDESTCRIIGKSFSDSGRSGTYVDFPLRTKKTLVFRVQMLSARIPRRPREADCQVFIQRSGVPLMSGSSPFRGDACQTSALRNSYFMTAHVCSLGFYHMGIHLGAHR